MHKQAVCHKIFLLSASLKSMSLWHPLLHLVSAQVPVSQRTSHLSRTLLSSVGSQAQYTQIKFSTWMEFHQIRIFHRWRSSISHVYTTHQQETPVWRFVGWKKSPCLQSQGRKRRENKESEMWRKWKVCSCRKYSISLTHVQYAFNFITLFKVVKAIYIRRKK